MINQVFAFSVNVKGRNWDSVINHRTAGKAKAEYLRSVQDSWPDVQFTDITCHKIGERPETNESFIRTAEYRGLPTLRCGSHVVVGTATGVIIGHDSSANFRVLFDDDSPQYQGLILSVHPQEMKIMEK